MTRAASALFAVVFPTLLFAASCQRDAPPAEVTSDSTTLSGSSAAIAAKPSPSEGAPSLRSDLEQICHAEERSGALDIEEAARALHVAHWLGGKIQTEAGRQFLAKLAGLSPPEKVGLLRSEASRQGLADCPLAKAWSGGE